MTVKGVLRLSTPIWVRGDCLGAQLPVVLGECNAQMRTPSAPVDRSQDHLVGWQVPGFTEVLLPGQTSFNDRTGWGEIGISAVDDSPHFYQLAAVLVEFESFNSELESGKESDAWVERLRLWAGASFGQYTSPLPRRDGLRVRGSSLRVWKETPVGIEKLSTSVTEVTLNNDGTVAGTEINVLGIGDLKNLVGKVSSGEDPPLALTLMATARDNAAQLNTRQAVVDAAAAVELVLRQSIETRLDPVDTALRKKLLGRNLTLGTLVDCSGVNAHVSNITERLVSLRNDVMHKAKTPTRGEMAQAIETAKRVLELQDIAPHVV